jgi:hypothetical protein
MAQLVFELERTGWKRNDVDPDAAAKDSRYALPLTRASPPGGWTAKVTAKGLTCGGRLRIHTTRRRAQICRTNDHERPCMPHLYLRIRGSCQQEVGKHASEMLNELRFQPLPVS